MEEKGESLRKGTLELRCEAEKVGEQRMNFPRNFLIKEGK